MGNTSVKTACNPRFLRLDWGISACRNSRYELVCNSMRFGGAMISLILPKLIRSAVARDGMFTFSQCPACAGPFIFNLTTQGKSAAFDSELAKFQATMG